MAALIHIVQRAKIDYIDDTTSQQLTIDALHRVTRKSSIWAKEVISARSEDPLDTTRKWAQDREQ